MFSMKAIHWGVLVMTLGCASVAHTQVVSRLSAKQDSSKERFVGAWHLVRIEAPGTGGTSTGMPQPKGMLIYTRDGHMSVQLMYPAAAKAPDNEYVRNGYEASFGSYDINEAAHTVTHHVQGSITREALVGKDLPRRYQFTKSGHLIIRSADAKETWYVTWEHE
jgi:lipocalin-like protein